jgi:hypothetical protein
LGYAEGYDLLAIDEAQEIPQIGKALKILVDQAPNLSIIVTGSSSFELAGQIGEPLTGRKRTLTLYPIAQAELLSVQNRWELRENLEHEYANAYFWRTHDQQAIDLVEERDGGLFGYECKWSSKKRVAAPTSWLSGYPEAHFSVISPDSYQTFVLPP